jgi:hypothetical protein
MLRRLASLQSDIQESSMYVSISAMAVLLAAKLCLAPLAWAADADGHFAIKGVGLQSCADYLAAREAKSPQYHQFGGWMNGYLSATNRYEDDTFDLVPWQSTGMLAAWLAGACEKNRDAQFVRVVTLLVNALGEERLRARSALVEYETDEGTDYVYAEVLRRAQQRLVDAGLYEGPFNGQLDTATKDALSRFQAEQDLAATGLPDRRTLPVLFDE